MALIKCAECGHEISDKAASCPQCGCPQGAAAVNGSSDPGLLTNPQLPRMANWICVYCLAVNPVFQVFALLLSGLTSSLWSLPLDISITVVLILSGLKLKRLQASSRQWVTWGLYASLGIDAFELWAGMFINTGDATGAMSGGMVVFLLLLLLFFVAAIIFRIVALVWLHRHGHELPLEDSALR